MSKNRIYTVEITAYPKECLEYVHEQDELLPRDNWEPEGWDRTSGPFRWPATNRVYLSRSSAQDRINIIEAWGGKAVLLECNPSWVPVSVANRKREQARRMFTAARLRQKLARLEQDAA